MQHAEGFKQIHNQRAGLQESFTQRKAILALTPVRDPTAASESDPRSSFPCVRFEVEGGALTIVAKSLVPEAAVLQAEQPAMLNLRKTYGKTIHTWQYDIHPHLPLGPPSLMMALNSHEEMPE